MRNFIQQFKFTLALAFAFGCLAATAFYIYTPGLILLLLAGNCTFFALGYLSHKELQEMHERQHAIYKKEIADIDKKYQVIKGLHE